MILQVDSRIRSKLGPKTADLTAMLISLGKIDGEFQEVTDKFCEDLGISMFQFRKIRDFGKILGLIDIKRVGRPNRTNISLKMERYNDILTSEQTDYGYKI